MQLSIIGDIFLENRLASLLLSYNTGPGMGNVTHHGIDKWADESQTPYKWLKAPDGIFIWRDIKAFFFKDDGTVYKLALHENADDWCFHTHLYNQVKNDPRCMIERPIYTRTLTMNSLLYSYSIVTRPNNELGSDIFQCWINNKLTTAYMLKMVSDTTVLLDHCKSMMTYYTGQFPSFAPKYGTNSQSVFWFDFKYCTQDLDSFIKIQLRALYINLGQIKYMFANTDIDIYEIIGKAKEEWKL